MIKTSLPLALAFALAPLAAVSAQAIPGEPQTKAAPPIASFSDLPLAEATAARCGVAFAAVQQWQTTGDARGERWPAMNETSAREFFVRAMAQIMEKHALDRSAVSQLVQQEIEDHLADEGAGIAAMMPGCLLALEASGY